MKGIFNIFRKDEKAFKGLESAIVLTVFVVVAAMFSYVVLGVGFTTSDTAKKTIDEDVKQTNYSVELAGDVIAEGTSGDTPRVDTIIITLQLTEGQSPIDIGADSNAGMMVISYFDRGVYLQETTWVQKFVGNNDLDNVLEQHEKVQITINVPEGANLQSENAADVVNREFKLEIKPKIGTIVPINRVTPPQIDTVMNLN